MFLRKLLLAGVAGSSLFAAGAMAADLPVRAPAPAPVIMAPVFTWTGFYVGANVGYGMVQGDRVGIRTFPANVFVNPVQGSVDGNGVFGGIQAGYNIQYGSIVFGLEADAQLSGIRGTATGNLVNTRASIDWFGTLRGRLGYLITPNLMIYGTAGGAMTDVNYRWTGVAPFAPLRASNERFGWTAGGGLEYAVNNNWSVKGEYLYVSTGKNRLVNVAQTHSTLETQSFWAVRLGVNYRFGGPSGPVVAKY